MIEKLNKRTTLSITIIVGFAIFAMFFGAGNLIYPLSVGAHSGPNVLFGLLGFLIAGIIIPLLGLFAISLYHGNYKHFFAQIGRVPGFIVALLVIILLGIFVATPRCSFISFGTLTPIFPS
ncbi:MAG: branched-chain amino acid transport system II carrier protein, partial [Pseudomonadota bacterium]